jgi:hypothetical protein
MGDAMLPEFEHEMGLTRRLLERVPEDQFDWKPHAKSMSLGQLAQHVATLPAWGSLTLTRQEFDLTSSPEAAPMRSRAELLTAFDGHVLNTRTALVGKTDAELLASWTLKKD